MQEIIQFIIHHWVLSGLFILLLILLMVEEARSKGLFGQLQPQELVHLMNRESAAVVDIRDRQAFQQGHIVGSIHLPHAELLKNPSVLDKYKNRPIIIVCAGGQKAAEVATQLKKNNFETVRVLSGGIHAWKSAQMPLVK